MGEMFWGWEGNSDAVSIRIATTYKLLLEELRSLVLLFSNNVT
jgi:hypothetical protein